jgi:hypothetical protein
MVPSMTTLNLTSNMEIKDVFLGANNMLQVDLEEDGVAVNLSSVTRIKAVFDDTVIDSDVHSGVFNWATGTTGRIQMVFGGCTIPVKNYASVPLLLIDPSNPEGQVWMLPFQINVKRVLPST